MYENILKKYGLKRTKSRELILDILENSKEPMNADEIFLKVRKLHELNFSTVYRTLSVLLEKSILLKNTGVDGKAYFQINNHTHNHYLVCYKCHKRIPIDACPLEEMGEELMKKTGFHITGHNLEFMGECRECLQGK